MPLDDLAEFKEKLLRLQEPEAAVYFDNASHPDFGDPTMDVPEEIFRRIVKRGLLKILTEEDAANALAKGAIMVRPDRPEAPGLMQTYSFGYRNGRYALTHEEKTREPVPSHLITFAVIVQQNLNAYQSVELRPELEKSLPY